MNYLLIFLIVFFLFCFQKNIKYLFTNNSTEYYDPNIDYSALYKDQYGANYDEESEDVVYIPPTSATADTPATGGRYAVQPTGYGESEVAGTVSNSNKAFTWGWGWNRYNLSKNDPAYNNLYTYVMTNGNGNAATNTNGNSEPVVITNGNGEPAVIVTNGEPVTVTNSDGETIVTNGNASVVTNSRSTRKYSPAALYDQISRNLFGFL